MYNYTLNNNNNNNVYLVDGSWGEWSDWSAITQTCGVGEHTRTRVCDNPPPENGGAECNGNAEETEMITLSEECTTTTTTTTVETTVPADTTALTSKTPYLVGPELTDENCWRSGKY